MFGTIVAWLVAGQPAHYLYFLAALYALAEYLLPRTSSVAARSALEGVANLLRFVPGVGAIFERFGTPRPAPNSDATAGPGSDSGSGSGAATFAVALLIALSASACAAFNAQPVALRNAEASALQCGAQAVQTGMQQLSPAILDALAGDSPDWREQLGKLEVTGTNALLCAVAHSLFDALGADLATFAEVDLERLVARRLLLADAGAQPPLPTPTRRVLARGLAYLRERGVARPPKPVSP